MPIHSCTLPGGGSGFKWGHAGKCYENRSDAEKQAAAAHANGFVGDEALAFDRDGTVRTTDRFGRLHIAITHISKANVCGYRGTEIPGYLAMGLEPDRIYMLLRDPEELRKAAPTFNNLPVLSRHVPHSSKDPQKDITVGSTGTDASFDGVYLDNSMVIWELNAIMGVENEVQKEISASYGYKVDMTPGAFQGQRYDGRMTDIVGNHVAIVKKGRAGPDVVVGDEQPQTEVRSMAVKKVLSPRAAVAKTFLMSELRKLLANDAELGAPIDVLEALQPDVAQQPEVVADNDPVAMVQQMLAGRVSDEELAKIIGCIKKDEAPPAAVPPAAVVPPVAKDTPPPFEGKPKDPGAIDKPAMDAAIETARKETVAQMRAVREAEKDVHPFLGEVVAMDSAENVYKMALDHFRTAGHDVHLDGVPASSYQALFRTMAPLVQKAQNRPVRNLANDSAVDVSGFAARFPNAAVRTV